MKHVFILSLLVCLVASGCGVKGAPMPRKDEAFIRPSEVRKAAPVESKKEDLIKKKEKR
ncbi:MAG: hypothetical protein ACRBBP_06365 [Bdellovibrionales bacterium]